jgi:hypothetical protein
VAHVAAFGDGAVDRARSASVNALSVMASSLASQRLAVTTAGAGLRKAQIGANNAATAVGLDGK